jgi:hypothetical protein
MPLTTALALVLPFAPASADTDPSGSAFGVAAHGPITIRPVPSVLTSTTEIARKSQFRGIGQWLTASALSVTASPDHATSSVADLSALRSKLRAHAIAAHCQNGQGGAHLTQATLAGKNLDIDPAPNTRLPITADSLGTVALTLNKQVVRPDGRLTVTAIALTLPLGGGRSQTIDIASATCGGDARSATITGTGAPSIQGAPDGEPGTAMIDGPATVEEAPAVKEAPAPTPVKGALPVTG